MANTDRLAMAGQCIRETGASEVADMLRKTLSNADDLADIVRSRLGMVLVPYAEDPIESPSHPRRQLSPLFEDLYQINQELNVRLADIRATLERVDL